MKITQKKYQFPSSNGGEIIKTLARPEPERLRNILTLFGKKTFIELTHDGGLLEYAGLILDLPLDMDRFRNVLDVCLEEGHKGLVLETMDTRLTDEVIQDFFGQRAKMFRERSLSFPSSTATIIPNQEG